jgi:hypothetical protein
VKNHQGKKQRKKANCTHGGGSDTCALAVSKTSGRLLMNNMFDFL